MKKRLLALALAAAFAPLAAAQSDEAWKKELETKVDMLTRELERSRMGGEGPSEARPALPVSPYSLGSGAAAVYGANKALSFAGYGEMVFQGPKGGPAKIDQTRAVLYSGYRFSDGILFDSELEFEGGNTAAGGEVGVEFAFLDFALSKALGFRVGKVLVPVGLTNEYHEPTVFNGALRPDLEKWVIPTTWAENGVGWYGESGPLAYRGTLTAGLRATGMAADEGLHDARQEGADSLARNPGVSQRLDFIGVPGLLFGAAVFFGRAGQGDLTPGSVLIKAPVTVWEAHARGEVSGFGFKAIYAQATVGDAGAVNEFKGVTGAASVGSVLRGGYVEGSYNILALLAPSSSQAVEAFVRYERYDTQAKVPAGYASDPANDRKVLTVGAGWRPIPRVVLKADYQVRSNGAGTGVNQVNLASGYEF